MPNDVTIRLQVSGPSEVLAEFGSSHIFTRCDNGELYFDFNTIIPMPAALSCASQAPATPTMEANEQKYGYASWYEFRSINWGTKWNSYSNKIEFVQESDKCYYQIKFETAWSLPIPIFKELSDLYPELMFYFECVEEGGFFSGTMQFSDDIVVDNVTNDSDEWKRWARTLYPDYVENQISYISSDLDYYLKREDPFTAVDDIIALLADLSTYDYDKAKEYFGKFKLLADAKNILLSLPDKPEEK